MFKISYIPSQCTGPPVELNGNLLTCLRKGTDTVPGNYIKYAVKDQMLFLLDVKGDYCDPRPEKCRCKNMLNDVLNEMPDLMGIDGLFTAKPFIAGCRCYLGASARNGFHYVQLKTSISPCNEKKMITTHTYVDVCNWYLENECDKPLGSAKRGIMTKY